MITTASIECSTDGELARQLAILRTVDTAHKERRISSNMRYEILQNLFPPVEPRVSGARDFRARTIQANRFDIKLANDVWPRSRTKDWQKV